MKCPACHWPCRTLLTLCAVLGVIAVAAVLALPAAAHQHEGHEGGEGGEAHGSPFTPEQMAAWQKAMTPGEAHRELASHAGDWKFVGKFWVDPSSEEPMVTEGTADRHLELDGRVLVEEVNAEMMGAPFHGIGRTGYDNVTGEYWSTWTDNMSTGVLVMRGKWSDEAGGVVYKGSHADAMNAGETVWVKMVVKTDDDRQVADYYEKRSEGADWAKTMELVFTRE